MAARVQIFYYFAILVLDKQTKQSIQYQIFHLKCYTSNKNSHKYTTGNSEFLFSETHNCKIHKLWLCLRRNDQIWSC